MRNFQRKWLLRGRKERRAGRVNLRSSEDELMKLGSFLCGYFNVKVLVTKKTKDNVNDRKKYWQRTVGKGWHLRPLFSVKRGSFPSSSHLTGWGQREKVEVSEHTRTIPAHLPVEPDILSHYLLGGKGREHNTKQSYKYNPLQSGNS